MATTKWKMKRIYYVCTAAAAAIRDTGSRNGSIVVLDDDPLEPFLCQSPYVKMRFDISGQNTRRKEERNDTTLDAMEHV